MPRTGEKRDDSLRAIGVTSVAIDKVTKAGLKRLAGNTPMCNKLKELVIKALNSLGDEKES